MTTRCEIVAPKCSKIEDLIAVGRDADVLVGHRIPQRMVEEAKNVKLIQIINTGMVDSEPGGTDRGFLLETLKGKDVLLGNISDPKGGNVYTAAIAEEGFALMLALAKRLLAAHLAYSSGEYYPLNENTWSVLLSGKTLGIVGLGRLGRQVAKRAKAFEMRVIACDKISGRELAKEGVDQVLPPEDLHKLLGQSDVVMLTVPLTFETYGLIGEAELRSMKKTAYLVNIARGFLVQEGPLHRALAEGWIAGFGSDVWWNYRTHAPAPSQTGVHKLPNVIVSNDRATHTPESREAFVKSAFENIDDFAKGEKPRYLVDTSRLY
jgi:D-3-phosphoglycerate dehydrogenase